MSSILGKTASGPISAEEIEVWELEGASNTTYYTEELSALCPVTHQPDIYSAEITYLAPVTFESKGMKHYLWGFRDQGISCEALAHKIATDLSHALNHPVTVTLTQQVRGGLSLSASVTGWL